MTKVKQEAPLAIWEPRFSTFKVKCPTCWRTLYHDDRDYVEDTLLHRAPGNVATAELVRRMAEQNRAYHPVDG